MPLHDEALRLQSNQGTRHRVRVEVQRARERGGGRRPHTLEPAAHELEGGLVAAPGPRRQLADGVDGGRRPRPGVQGPHLREPFRRHPAAIARGRLQTRGSPLRLQLGEQRRLLRRHRLPGRVRQSFGVGEHAEEQQRVVQLVRRARLGPGLRAHPLDGVAVEAPEIVRAVDIEEAPRLHRARAPLLRRGVVEEGVGTRGQNLACERRRLGQIARHDADGALDEAFEQSLEPAQVHHLVQAVAQSLPHQRMLGHLALTDEVLLAGELIRKHHGDEVLGIGTLQRRRHALAVAIAPDGEGDVGDPAPAPREQRHSEQGLHQNVAHRRRVQVVPDLLEREAVGRPERQHDAVLERGRLQLEVEAAAEALAQREPPGAIDA